MSALVVLPENVGITSSAAPHAGGQAGELQRQPTIYPSTISAFHDRSDVERRQHALLYTFLFRDTVEMARPEQTTVSRARLPLMASYRLLIVSLFFGLASLAWGYACSSHIQTMLTAD